MAKKHKHPEHVNNERWLVSYADFITLLFAFFVVMFASSQTDAKKIQKFSEAFSEAVGIHKDTAGEGLLAGPPEPRLIDLAANPELLPKDLEALQKALDNRAKQDGLEGVKVTVVNGELQYDMAEKLVFDSGDDKIKPDAITALMGLADHVREGKFELRVEGHTDNIPIASGRFPSNWELSTSRAMAVLRVLADEGRIASHRLSAAGYGEFRPVASNDTTDGRARNRRVLIVVSLRTGTKTAEPNAAAHVKLDPMPASAVPAEAAHAAGEPAHAPAAHEPAHAAPAAEHH